MSKTIDERVVEMRFDNKEFESRAKESIGTLTKLREALSISTKDSAKSLQGLDQAAKNVSLEGLSAGVEALQKRFSTLGIVGMRVIENITDSMMNTLGRGINYITDSIVSGGIRRAMNIENAHFQLQALLKDEEKVQAVMDDAMKSVDGTAYAYDEAARAASQFAATGIEAGDEMLNALRGIVGVSAMTNSEFESISQIFTTVAGNGRLMGDQLLQLGSRGLNAAATISDFVNGVTDGSKKASDEVTALVKNITGGAKVTQADIRELVSDGQISFKLFSEAMTDAFADSAERANETFTGALSNIKSALARIGAGFISPLVAQNSEIVSLFNAARERINDVKKALVFDEEIGNVNALSKQFTDTVLFMAKGAAEFIRNVDLSKPMAIFYNFVETAKNLGKGLYTVLKPLGQAFSEVFLSFSMDDVVNLSAKIEEVTRNMRFTERGSQELKDALKGLFSVVKLVVDIFIDLIRVFVPTVQPINTLTGGIIGLAGAIGRSLTTFTEWFRSSQTILKIYTLVSNAVYRTMISFNDFMLNIASFMNKIYNLQPVQELIYRMSQGFNNLKSNAANGISIIIKKIQEFRDSVLKLLPVVDEEGLIAVISDIASGINKFMTKVGNINLTKPKQAFESFKNVLKSLLEVLKGNEGLNTFVTNMKKFFLDLTEAFSMEKILEKIKTFRDTVSDFVVWIKGLLGPLADIFSEFSLGGAISTAGGVGLIYGIIKMAKSFEKVATTIEKIPNILGSLNGAIKEYQNNLKADTLKKVATAILLLSGALVLLSFADTERVMKSAVALTLIAGVLLAGVNKFIDVAKKTKTIDDVIFMFSRAANNLAKAVKWKAIGSAFKDFATSILLIIGSIVAVYVMYRKDPEALEKAGMVVGIISGALIAFGGLMTLMGNKFDKGSSNFAKSALGILALSGSLMLAVSALGKLFKMELPTDWKQKLGILVGILGGLGILALALGRASKETASYMHSGDLTGGQTISTSTGHGNVGATPILALAATLYVSVLALDRLFKMDLPTDYGVKIGILAGLFIALGGLVLAVGYASKLAGGAVKATGTILAMCLFIGVAIGALMILSIFPAEKLIKGAVSLGILLVSLGTALYGAGKITTKDTWKSVLSMSIAVGTITAALGVLSMIPWEKLLKASIALGSVLLALATDFVAVGKISNDKAWLNILAMVAAVVAVSFSLVQLAQQPWENLLAAGAAMSMVLLTFASTLHSLSSMGNIDKGKLGTFLAGIASLGVISYSLFQLAKQPWENLLAAGTSLSLTLMAFAGAFVIISTTSINQSAMVSFLAGVVGLVGIGIVLFELAKHPWENLLAAAASLSLVLLSMSGVLAVCSIIGTMAPEALVGIGLLDLLIIDLGAIMVGIGAIFQNISSLEGYLDKGIEILVKIGEGLGRFAGSIVSGILQEASSSFPVIGENLSAFMDKGDKFFTGISKVDEGTVKSVSYLAQAILLMTANSVLDGLTSWFTGGSSMASFGEELENFAPHFANYAAAISGIKPAAVEASANAALALAEMASKLPNSGGLAAKILGDNTLSAFGEELAKFGPIIRRYSLSVTGIDTGAVEASANAAQVMADMASKLPNSGGLAAKILGDNKLSDFGRELAQFGPFLRLYALSITGLNADVVTNSANAAKALSELANGLPNSGGLISWFTGDNDISKFGASLVKFGEGLKAYYESVSGIDISKLDEVVQEVKELINIATMTSGLDVSGMSGFSTALKTMGNKGINEFISAFNESHERVTTAVTTMLTAVINSMQLKTEMFMKVGTNSAIQYLNGIKTRYLEGVLVGITLASKVTSSLEQLVATFQSKGVASANQYLSGIRSKYPEASSAGTSLANNVLNGIQSVNLYGAGENAGKGFVNGLKSTLGLAAEAGKAIGNAAYEAAKKSLDEHSPSKKMGEVGEFAGIGFINALMYFIAKAADTGEKLGEEAVKGASNGIGNISRVITEDMFTDPVIEPIVDLSNVEESIREINRLFSSAINLTAFNASSVADSVSNHRGNINGENIQNQDSGKSVNYFNFNQVNNSPKALSRSDIYRQSKNMFSRFEEAVNRG